jgi:hypothetical protein
VRLCSVFDGASTRPNRRTASASKQKKSAARRLWPSRSGRPPAPSGTETRPSRLCRCVLVAKRAARRLRFEGLLRIP